nr:MAG TPA: hypothetical protein [Caudoviricetes sp.]
MKVRWSKSQIDLFVVRKLAKGDKKLSDLKQGSTRIITLTSVRIICKSNGWVELQPLCQ